jgi:hypothetical protein
VPVVFWLSSTQNYMEDDWKVNEHGQRERCALLGSRAMDEEQCVADTVAGANFGERSNIFIKFQPWNLISRGLRRDEGDLLYRTPNRDTFTQLLLLPAHAFNSFAAAAFVNHGLSVVFMPWPND